MKKKLSTLILVFILLFQTGFNMAMIVEAAGSISVSTSKPGLGSTVSITVHYSSSTATTFNFRVKSSNNSIISLNEQVFDSGQGNQGTKSGSRTFTVKASSLGDVNIYIDGNDSISVENLSYVEVSGSTSLKVVEANTSSGNQPSKPQTPGTPTPKPPVKTPEQLENEKKEAEAKELEKRKITPLISSISVISKSEKRADDVLIAFNPGESEFALEYTLPKRIENFSLDIAADEGVTLDYVADYVMDADEKVITIKAIGSEFTQEYALTVKRDLREDAVLTVGDTPMKVYTDDLLTERMSAFGFTYEEYPLNELISSYFTLGENKVQLLVDESNNARWYMLSGELIPTREVVLSVFNEKPFIIYDADDVDVIDEKLHGNSYVKHDLVVPESLATVDSTLKFKTDYLAWDYKDGEVVYGYGYEGKDGMHYLTDVEVVGAALVAFDQVDTSMRTIAIVSTTGFIIVSAYVLVTTLMNVRKRKSLQ